MSALHKRSLHKGSVDSSALTQSQKAAFLDKMFSNKKISSAWKDLRR